MTRLSLTLVTLLLLTMFILAGCRSKSANASDDEASYSEARISMEQEAKLYLMQARLQMEKGQYLTAKKTINIMRKKCYLAITARQQAIILMDSLDLFIAKDKLVRVDSLLRINHPSVKERDLEEACRQVDFYTKKIAHDKQDTGN